MVDAEAGKLFARIPPPQRDDLLQAFADGSPEERVAAVEAALDSSGPEWRAQAGAWIAGLLAVERLVPDAVASWRPLVRDAMAFVASHLSTSRLAPKIVEQIDLPPDTPPEMRLGLVIAKTPGLQKLGQVIARVRRLTPELRAELQKLENGIRDISAREVQALIHDRLEPALRAYQVELAPQLLSEASVSAILEFSWMNWATGKRENGVFKVLKPHVPACYAEDLDLLQQLAEHLRTQKQYPVSREVTETLDDVRRLLASEVDFRREQATLAEVRRVYPRRGVRTPRPIPELSTDEITAMSVERGRKVTEGQGLAAWQRRQLASQMVAFLVGDPIFAAHDGALVHADPHAGNLLFDEATGDLIVLDWALTTRLGLAERRHIGRLMLAMTFRDATGVRDAMRALSRGAGAPDAATEAVVAREVDQFFARLPFACSLTALDAMHLLERVGMAGVRFPASLVLVRKVLFTLDGVLHDVAGGEVRLDTVLLREFLARCARPSLPPPFGLADYLAVQFSAWRYATGLWAWDRPVV
jgi:ubiquinone biosynthesis protein